MAKEAKFLTVKYLTGLAQNPAVLTSTVDVSIAQRTAFKTYGNLESQFRAEPKILASKRLGYISLKLQNPWLET